MKKQLEILSLSDEIEKKVEDWCEASYTTNKGLICFQKRFVRDYLI